MLDIMKAIYDMMGKCTYPVLKEETPRQHVEVFFQASVLRLSGAGRPAFFLSSCLSSPLALSLCLQQKMDKNKDGVVTIDEFIDCCQNVSGQGPPPPSSSSAAPLPHDTVFSLCAG